MSPSLMRRVLGSGFLSTSMLLLCVDALDARTPDGAQLFYSACGGCHGSDARGGEHAPNIATSPEVQHLTDSELSSAVEKGIPGTGMPAFASMGQDNITAIVAYLRMLQGRGSVVNVPGNARNGEALFNGKAGCAECHMMNGTGGFIGSDLSLYGADASPADIRSVILDPDRNLPKEKYLVTVTSKGSQIYSGMLRQQDNFSLTLQSADGSFHYFRKADLSSLVKESHSLMPADYASRLSTTEVDDVVSYLIRNGTEKAARAGRKEAKSDDDEE